MAVPSKLLNTHQHRIEKNFHRLKYVIKFQITMSEIIIRQLAVPLQLLFHFFNHCPGLTFIGLLPQKYGYFSELCQDSNHLTEEIKMRNLVCLDMRSQNVQTLSLFLTSALRYRYLVCWNKKKFGYIILRSSQTAVFGPSKSRSVCQRYRSGSGFASGFQICTLFSSIALRYRYLVCWK